MIVGAQPRGQRLASRAFIDFRESPRGIDGRAGAQISGVGTVAEVRRLAERLR